MFPLLSFAGKSVAQSVENLILGGYCPLPLSANDVPAMKGSFSLMQRGLSAMTFRTAWVTVRRDFSHFTLCSLTAKFHYALQVADRSQTSFPTWLSTSSGGSATSLRLFESKPGRRQFELSRYQSINQSIY